MITAPFEYVRASTTDEILSLLAEHGDDAKLIAGGHSLLPMMKLRLASPSVLIDIARVPSLTGVTVDGDDLVIGACTRHAAVAGSAEVLADAPLLAHSAGQVGDPQVRHRGTLGGSLAHADPAADLPMAALALDARLEVTGPAGVRTVAVDEFFLGFFETAVGPDEFLSAIRVPRRPGAGWGYEKFTRRANDWAVVGVATVAGRIALANMGPTALRARAAEDALVDGASIADAAALAAEGTSPAADIHADEAYRAHLARVLTRRALEAATITRR